MQNYFGAFNFGEFKPHTSNTMYYTNKSSYSVNFVPFDLAVLFVSGNSQSNGHSNVSSAAHRTTVDVSRCCGLKS